MYVLNSLAPIFIIIALGAMLLKAGFLSQEHLNSLNRLTYWIGLPCLLFSKIAVAHFSGDQAGRILLLVVTGMVGALIAGYIAAKILQVPVKSVGTFVQASFRSNMAFIGLPVIIYTSSDLYGLDANSMEMLGVLVIAPMVVIYNFFSVIVLLVSQQKFELKSLSKIVKSITTNPLLVASVAGLLFAFSRVPLPIALNRTFRVVGEMSLPLALLSIGGSLVFVKFRGSLKYAVVAAFLKIALSPFIGYYIGKLLGMGADEVRIALIYLACPTAAASYVLTDQIGGDNALAASAVVVSTILAMFSLGIVIGLS